MTDFAPPEDIVQLEQPAAHPHDASAQRGVAGVQTHISHVFLSPERVYKFRKPVSLGFVDFSTLAERNADCSREIALNRRLAPDVYLGVAPLLRDGDRVWIGPVEEEIGEARSHLEHCVVMRRLEDGRDALSLLRKDALSGAQIDRVAVTLARFHARHRLGIPAPFPAREWRSRLVSPVEACFDSLSDSSAVDRRRVVRIRDSMRFFADRNSVRFDRRRRQGKIVDGHGDLHLQHIWFERDDSEPLIIDCIEFDEGLRVIDTASEVAFLAMDLRYRRRDPLADRFLEVYAEQTDDMDLFAVVDYFIAYRALVRAKVAAIAAGDEAIDADQRQRSARSAQRHLDLASRALGLEAGPD